MTDRQNLRGLFVTHSTGIGGGEKSLALALKGLQQFHGIHADLAVHCPPGASRNFDFSAAAERFNLTAEQIRPFYLPWSNIYQGRKNGVSAGLWAMVRRLLWRLNRQKFYDLARGYDFIHLNSLVLNEMIREDLPFFTHVREILEADDRAAEKAFAQLKKARGVVFIDSTTQNLLKRVVVKNSTVINNPFDMHAVEEITKFPEKLAACRTRFPGSEFSADKTVIACIGVIAENKGVDFIISCFRQAKITDCVLMIVGKQNDSPYFRQCRAAADKNIVFIDETSEMAEIYAVSDYIIRGEAQFCVGRTVFEGLYAGCDVLMPGTASDLPREPELEKFANQVHLYEARNKESLTGLLQNLNGKKKPARPTLSNVEAWSDHFYNFITASI